MAAKHFVEDSTYHFRYASLLLKAFPLKILHHLVRPNFGVRVEVQVDLEFGSAAAARTEALRYLYAIGQLPTALRTDVKTVWLHKGLQPFGGGNNNLLIHSGQAEEYIRDGVLISGYSPTVFDVLCGRPGQMGYFCVSSVECVAAKAIDAQAVPAVEMNWSRP